MTDKLSIPPEMMAGLETKIASDKVLGNAFRLMRDANHLFDLGSYASTVALASLAIEEIGKHLIARWEKNDPEFWHDPRRRHQMKQDAVASVIATDSMRREYVARGIDFQNIADPQTKERLLEAIKTGFDKQKQLVNDIVGRKALELIKWSGMYYDEGSAAKGVEPENIKSSDAEAVMQLASRSFMAIADDRAVAVGKTFFTIVHKPRS